MTEPNLTEPLPPPPETPAGFTRLGWEGMVLLLPAEWNLALHEGNWHRGVLVLKDLEAVRMAVRWRTPRFLGLVGRRDPRKTLRTLVQQMSRHRKARAVGEQAAEFEWEGQTLVLLADFDRVYELHWPVPAPEIETIRNDFLTGVSGAASEEWYWSVYGASGWVPARATLERASLLPGECRLAFRAAGGRLITLGSRSMADRELADGSSLRNWAEKKLQGVATGGEWHEEPDRCGCTATSKGGAGVLRRPLVDELTVRHERAENRICWTHCVKRAKS